MTGPIDYSGLAVLVTAITGLIAGVGTIVLQGISLSRQSTNAAAQKVSMDSLHVCVHEKAEEIKNVVTEQTEEVKAVVTNGAGKN